MKTLLIIISFFVFLSCSHTSQRTPQQTYLSQSYDFFEQSRITSLVDTQRVGMLLESPESEFKGCVIYLQGFGDSILNHYPLYNQLRKNGYRVLAFDYFGQGGSQGSMNDVGVDLIEQQAKLVWDYYSKTEDPIYKRTCKGSKKRVIGWSLGGLATYQMASNKWGDVYVLINPALVPRWCVGETANFCLNNIGIKKPVTFRTLTRNRFDAYTNPHLEPVKPADPLSYPLFLTGLITKSFSARMWKIDASEKMLFLLSGVHDAYVDTEEITRVIDHKVGWYRMYPYADAYHELDNEMPDVSEDVHRRIVQFFEDHN